MTMNSNTDLRKQLVEMVKAAGLEMIDRAEDLVGNAYLLSDFDICVHFPIDGRMFTGVPTIDVTRSHASKKCLDVLIGKEE